jgi:hypothetical protein
LIILTPKVITGEQLVTSAGFGSMGGKDVKAVKEYSPLDKIENPNEFGERQNVLPSEVFVNVEGNTMTLKGPR